MRQRENIAFRPPRGLTQTQIVAVGMFLASLLSTEINQAGGEGGGQRVPHHLLNVWDRDKVNIIPKVRH